VEGTKAARTTLVLFTVHKNSIVHSTIPVHNTMTIISTISSRFPPILGLTSEGLSLLGKSVTGYVFVCMCAWVCTRVCVCVCVCVCKRACTVLLTGTSFYHQWYVYTSQPPRLFHACPGLVGAGHGESSVSVFV